MAEPGDGGAMRDGMPPRWLERLAASCFGANADDCRLGDLSENYVRTQRRLTGAFGSMPLAMAASHFVSLTQYLAAAANVMLFARAVDPGRQFVENGAAALVAFDLRERTMAMLHVAVRRLALPALLLICSALMINNAIDTWRSWRQAEALMASLQHEKAEAAAQKIGSFVREIERQIGWVAYPQWDALPLEQRRFEYVRLLRQVPAITELTQLDRSGHEQLRVSRLSMDVVGSNLDRSADPAVIEAKANRASYGPAYFRKNSEPYLTMAVSHGGRGGITLADINLKLVWDVIADVKVGEAGFAYIVDNTGRLIAGRGVKNVLHGPNLSGLPQVAAALAGPPSGQLVDGMTFNAGVPREAVLSAHAAVPGLNWRVFVDLPTAETSGSFWGAVIRGASLLGLGLVAAVLAILLAVRPVKISRLAAA
jgi:hypothetical protein